MHPAEWKIVLEALGRAVLALDGVASAHPPVTASLAGIEEQLGVIAERLGELAAELRTVRRVAL